MYIILNLPKGSAYAHLNRHTFKVKETFGNFVSIDIDGATVDFYPGEVIVVDFLKEIQAAYDAQNYFKLKFSRPVEYDGKKFRFLQKYAELNQVAYSLEYTCPS